MSKFVLNHQLWNTSSSSYALNLNSRKLKYKYMIVHLLISIIEEVHITIINILPKIIFGWQNVHVSACMRCVFIISFGCVWHQKWVAFQQVEQWWKWTGEELKRTEYICGYGSGVHYIAVSVQYTMRTLWHSDATVHCHQKNTHKKKLLFH